jgi:hypothetical protein
MNKKMAWIILLCIALLVVIDFASNYIEPAATPAAPAILITAWLVAGTAALCILGAAILLLFRKFCAGQIRHPYILALSVCYVMCFITIALLFSQTTSLEAGIGALFLSTTLFAASTVAGTILGKLLSSFKDVTDEPTTERNSREGL